MFISISRTLPGFVPVQDGKSVGFMWSQGGDQFELEEAHGSSHHRCSGSKQLIFLELLLFYDVFNVKHWC